MPAREAPTRGSKWLPVSPELASFGQKHFGIGQTFAQSFGGLVFLREPDKITRRHVFGSFAMGQIKSESLLFPQHAAPEIVIELSGNQQGRFAALGADRSCGDGIALKFEPVTGPNVDLWNHGDAASLRL